MTPQQEQKYINMAVAELYDRAIKYSKKYFSLNARTSGKERAIAKIMAIESCKTYNVVRGLLSSLGSSDLCKNQVIVWHKDFGDSLELMTDEEIEELIEKSFKVSRKSRTDIRTQEYQRTIDYLNKHPELAANMLMAADAIAAKNRGKIDSKKGGLVRHYIQNCGLSLQEARVRAQEDIDNEQIEARAKEIAKEQALVSYSDSETVPSESNDSSYDNFDSGQSYLDLLGGTNESERSDNHSISDDISDINDFSLADSQGSEKETDQILQSLARDSDGRQSEKLDNDRSDIESLMPEGTATELAAKELLLKAGIKDRSQGDKTNV